MLEIWIRFNCLHLLSCLCSNSCALEICLHAASLLAYNHKFQHKKIARELTSRNLCPKRSFHLGEQDLLIHRRLLATNTCWHHAREREMFVMVPPCFNVSQMSVLPKNLLPSLRIGARISCCRFRVWDPEQTQFRRSAERFLCDSFRTSWFCGKPATASLLRDATQVASLLVCDVGLRANAHLQSATCYSEIMFIFPDVVEDSPTFLCGKYNAWCISMTGNVVLRAKPKLEKVCCFSLTVSKVRTLWNTHLGLFVGKCNKYHLLWCVLWGSEQTTFGKR